METLGIILIIFGIFTILNLYLDINLWSTFFNLWPVLLIIYGVVRLFKKEKNSTLSILISALGIILLLSNFNLLTSTLRTIIWASTAIVIGLVFLLSNKNKGSKSNSKRYSSSDNYHDEYKINYKKIFSNLIDISYIFTNENIEIVSNSFSGGDIKTSFGQIVVNLKNVKPASNIMEIHCNVNISNLELIIPSTWSYEIIGKNVEEYKVMGETNILRIYYKNVLGELIVNQ